MESDDVREVLLPAVSNDKLLQNWWGPMSQSPLFFFPIWVPKFSFWPISGLKQFQYLPENVGRVTQEISDAVWHFNFVTFYC